MERFSAIESILRKTSRGLKPEQIALLLNIYYTLHLKFSQFISPSEVWHIMLLRADKLTDSKGRVVLIP